MDNLADAYTNKTVDERTELVTLFHPHRFSDKGIVDLTGPSNAVLPAVVFFHDGTTFLTYAEGEKKNNIGLSVVVHDNKKVRNYWHSIPSLHANLAQYADSCLRRPKSHAPRS